MSSPAKPFPWTVAAGLFLVLATLGMIVLLAELKSKPAAPPLPVISRIADFTLTNENGAATSLADLRGHVWVADIIFTRCPGPCLRMTRQMKELETGLSSDANTKLVSLTTDPDFDTPPVLTKYAERFGVDTNRWMFLTGTKKQIGDLATSSLKLTAIPKDASEQQSENDLFVHSTIFVIVDKQAQLRGVFETGGEGVDWSKSKQDILAAVKQLERE